MDGDRTRDLVLMGMSWDELVATHKRFKELRNLSREIGAHAAVIAQWSEQVEALGYEIDCRIAEDGAPF